MIIHTLKSMTIRQYAEYETERNVKYLFRRCRWMARIGLFNDDIEAFIAEFNKHFNTDGDDLLDKAWEQLETQGRLLQMQAFAEALQAHVIMRAELELMARTANVKISESRLPFYLEKIKEITGVEIKTLEDVYAYRDQLQFKIDKYNEKYNRPKEEKKPTYIQDLFYACCRINEATPDYNCMTLLEFSRFKKQAEERQKQLEALYNKNRNE